MRLVKYELNADGTIPAEIVNGGHFSAPNDKPSPQDLTLVGWTESESFGETVDDLKAYLLSIGADTWTNRFDEPVDLDSLVANFVSE